jgi:type IV pilus assembly protein PilM
MVQLTAKREKPLVGLEIEAGSVAATEVQGGTQLRKTAMAPLPEGVFHEGEVVDAPALAESLRALFADNKLSKRVRLGVANQGVVVRTVRLPAIDDPKQLDAAVRFQAQEQVPMPLEQAVLDHRVIGGVPASEDGPPQVDVMLVAARREMIDSYLRMLREAGLQPAGIDLSAFALIRALGDAGANPAPEPGTEDGAQAPAATGATLLCNVGDTTNLAISRRRACLFTRVAPVGLGAMATELAGASGLTPEHAQMWLTHVGLTEDTEAIAGDPALVAASREALRNGATALQGELRLSLDFYAAQEGAQRVERVVLAGPGSAIPGLPQAIEAGFGIPFEVGRPAELTGLGAATAARLTLPYGLALDA